MPGVFPACRPASPKLQRGEQAGAKADEVATNRTYPDADLKSKPALFGLQPERVSEAHAGKPLVTL
jgi:hypothetical protein